MEVKLKSLCLLSVIFLLMAVLPNDGRLLKKKFRFTKNRPTHRPPITNSSIPKEKCAKIFNRAPRKSPFLRLLKGPICVLLNETEKTARLQNVGGYVPRYVAVNRSEALQFVSLLGDVQPLPTRPPGSPPYNQSVLSSIFGQQDGTTGSRKRRSTITLPSVPGTTEIQECFQGGSLLEDDDGFRRLCTECFGITQLPEGVFPPFINEVICGDDSDFCVPGIGECQQRFIELQFLSFTGNFERDDDLSELLGLDAFVEELETIDVELRACCECRLFAFLI